MYMHLIINQISQFTIISILSPINLFFQIHTYQFLLIHFPILLKLVLQPSAVCSDIIFVFFIYI